MMPSDAVLAVTYRCNARCVMCGIWKTAPESELPPEAYTSLSSSLRDVNLTGGEPFLRDDLAAVHAAVQAACPHAQTVISTNGILTDRIVSAVREMKQTESNIGIAISIDGPAEVHDSLRGIHGAYNKAIATVKALQDIGIENLRLAFTALSINAQCLGAIYDLSRNLGVEFTCAIEHSSSHYFHTDEAPTKLPLDLLRREFAKIMSRELGTLSPKRWARAYFMQGMHDFAAGRGRRLPCRAGQGFFFMDPKGDVFTCNASPFFMGNLSEQSFETLWNSPKACAARDRAATCPAGCWMMCTARTAIKRAWPRVLLWALGARFLGLKIRESES